MSDLSPKQEAFCREFVKDFNATQAAIRAGYAPKNADVQGPRLLGNDGISSRIEQLCTPAIRQAEMDATRLVSEWCNIASADSRDLIAYKVGSCRYCHGEGNRYQRTPAERERDWAEHQTMVAAAWGDIPELKKVGHFDELGGVGFNPNIPPNPDCPECWGDGVGRPIVADTRTLSPAAASLFAGVKQTKDGVEVKQHDKMVALDRLAKFYKITGFGAGDEPDGGEPRKVLHLHLVRVLQELPYAQQEALRPILATLIGSASTVSK